METEKLDDPLTGCNCYECETRRKARMVASQKALAAGDGSLDPLARLRAIMLDRSEEVTNSIGGVIGYRITLDEDDTRRVFEIIDGIGTEPSQRSLDL